MSTEDDSVADLTGDWEVDAEEIEVAGVGGEAAQGVASAGAGLEIALSICPMNEIAEFWSDRCFLGQSAFIETMTRTQFQQIRGALTLHSPEHPRLTRREIRCGVVEESWNISGITMLSTPAERYTGLFPTLRTPLYNTLRADEVTIEQESTTALWIAIAGHQTRALRSPTDHRLVVSDNFYTRHTFAQALLKLTDGEMHLLGTVRMNLVDKWNKPAVSAAVARVDGDSRGGWELVAAVDPEPGWEKINRCIKLHNDVLLKQNEQPTHQQLSKLSELAISFTRTRNSHFLHQ
ncbi:PiggyBac transposable element-derived protein [Phytophthora cactorum]|nr:PiggyBac transposable element-derived protein [Phytophthora cactorum]